MPLHPPVAGTDMGRWPGASGPGLLPDAPTSSMDIRHTLSDPAIALTPETIRAVFCARAIVGRMAFGPMTIASETKDFNMTRLRTTLSLHSLSPLALRLILALLMVMTLLPGPAPAQSVRDDTGRVIGVSAPFTRIISLYSAHTENLFQLGLDDAIIGVTEHEDFPSTALEKPAFTARDSVDKLLAARPDLILIRPMQQADQPDLWAALERHGVTVAALQPDTVSEMYDYWRTLGTLTGREVQAEEMVGRFKDGLVLARQRMESIDPARRPGVFFESIHRRFATFAPGSMPIFVLETAGGRNVAADAASREGTNIADYGLERMLAKSSQIDVYLTQYGAMNSVTVRDIATGPAASRIKAVRDRNVFLVDERLVSRPTMRLLRGIETVHTLLHPTAWN
ncbi:ABC transporter substrate-binding protein [Pseudodesulfovibrio pelocollis]|uniref:ABC transporter substrate-binding protein n=1 Tax=Pseudodesulfovibrio pelocollis TaxID=3051432 RepID=UPI00255AEA6A|nr:ABC transporter substrate-binding protein [Pseudodesulfovibrio sp. SB368]